MDSDFLSAGADSINSEKVDYSEDGCDVEPPCDAPPKHAPVNTCSGGVCWPLVIFVILAIIVLIAILFNRQMDGTNKAWSFFVALIVVLIWALILWFFCKCGQQTIAWFLLLLPIAVAIFWALSSFLAGVSCGGCPNAEVCGESGK